MSETPIYDSVVEDTGIDYQAIKDRPLWNFAEAEQRIISNPVWKTLMRQKRAEIQKQEKINGRRKRSEGVT